MEHNHNDNSPSNEHKMASLAPRTLMVKVINAQQKLYSNQTGWFPIQSSCGNKLLMITYTVDGNYINAEPVLDSNQQSLITAYQKLPTRLTAAGHEKPTIHTLDNEASQAFKDEIQKIAHFNSFRPTLTVKILPNRLSRHLKGTSPPSYLEFTKISQCNSGMDWCLKTYSH